MAKKPLNITMPPVKSSPEINKLRGEIISMLDAIDHSVPDPTVENLTALRDSLKELCDKHKISLKSR